MVYVLFFMQSQDLELTGVSTSEPYPCHPTCIEVLSFHDTSSFTLFVRKQVLFHPTFILLCFVIHLLLFFIKGLNAVSLTTMCQSVKTLLIYMDYKVDIVVDLLQCFLKLENLFVEVMIFRNLHSVVLVPF